MKNFKIFQLIFIIFWLSSNSYAGFVSCTFTNSSIQQQYGMGPIFAAYCGLSIMGITSNPLGDFTAALTNSTCQADVVPGGTVTSYSYDNNVFSIVFSAPTSQIGFGTANYVCDGDPSTGVGGSSGTTQVPIPTWALLVMACGLTLISAHYRKSPRRLSEN